MKLPVKCFCLLLFIGLVLTVAGVRVVRAQDDEDFQSWNDLQVTIPINSRFDFFLQTTGRVGRNITRFNEGRVGAGLVWKVSKAFSVSPSYLYISARNTAGEFRIEHRYNLRGTYKFPIKSFGLSHRSLYEYRQRPSGNSWRYRPSLTFEKELPEKFMSNAKFFVTEEPFYVSTTGKFSRNRFSLGISKTLNKHLALDVYYLRQNDGFSHPGDLSVIGTSWKIKL